MSVLSVDPGDKRVGWAKWTETGGFMDGGIDSPEEFLQRLLRTGGVSTIVVENWKLRKDRNGSGRTMTSSEVIGYLVYHAAAQGCEIVRQEPGILRIAALHCDMKLSKGHIPDAKAAYLHGYWYFEAAGILKPKPLDQR